MIKRSIDQFAQHRGDQSAMGTDRVARGWCLLAGHAAGRWVSHPPAIRASAPPDDTPLGRINALATNLSGLAVPRKLVGGTPPEAPASLTYLRNRLLLASTPDDLRDRVWRHIAGTARTRRGDWNLYALGVAYPGLRSRARRLTRPPTPFGVVAAVHFTLAVEFLFALHDLRLDMPNVISRLLGTAYDRTSGRKRREPRWVDIDTVSEAELHAAMDRHRTHPVGGDPHDVLDRLVAATRTARDGYRFTPEHAALVAGTYLDGQRLYTVAATLGLSETNASKRRARAALLIARLLDHPHLAEQ